jgi:UDPglucose 6-dehydrogenase
MQYVLTAARNIGSRMVDPKVIVDKSTVPVGTADRVRETIAAELARRGIDLSFAVASNPEFLKEGAAVEDFMRPDRVVIGSDDERAIGLLRAVYAPFQRNHERLLVMDVRSAELTKYAANAMLATRISFMNELANLADALGADIEHVRRGIGSDPRIGYRFLYPGAGYGGSCFPKDVKALQATAKHHGRPLEILAAVESVNDTQKKRLLEKITQRFGPDLSNKKFAVWGLAFKANTDDMREAPSQTVVRGLLDRGASVTAYDPVAMDEARRVFGTTSRLAYAASPMDAVTGADALVVVTEWQEFRSPDFSELRRTLRQPLLFDGRNLFDPKEVRAAGLEYFGIGRP